MKVIFISNYLNHHQVYLSDAFYNLDDVEYYFVATEDVPSFRKKLGYPIIKRPYVINAYENDREKDRSFTLANQADVVIIGSAPEQLVEKRLKENKLTFHYSERWFKNLSYHIFSPRLWFSIWKNHVRYRNKRSYMLCASAFTAPDVHKAFAYPNKCFKWGYFTKVEKFDFEAAYVSKQGSVAHLMWCARFLALKHPELPVKMARKLKDLGYHFVLDMFGSGVEFDKTVELAHNLKVDDVVVFRGNLPNEEILRQMRKHDIFLFTSDRNEGWGAVTNESMSNGCAFVGSDAIGAVPFLVRDGENGLIFKSGSIDSLTEKVKFLIDNPDERKRLSINAYNTMLNEWSPSNAARNFLQLCQELECDSTSTIQEGPCSPA